MTIFNAQQETILGQIQEVLLKTLYGVDIMMVNALFQAQPEVIKYLMFVKYIQMTNLTQQSTTKHKYALR